MAASNRCPPAAFGAKATTEIACTSSAVLLDLECASTTSRAAYATWKCRRPIGKRRRTEPCSSTDRTRNVSSAPRIAAGRLKFRPRQFERQPTFTSSRRPTRASRTFTRGCCTFAWQLTLAVCPATRDGGHSFWTCQWPISCGRPRPSQPTRPQSGGRRHPRRSQRHTGLAHVRARHHGQPWRTHLPADRPRRPRPTNPAGHTSCQT